MFKMSYLNDLDCLTKNHSAHDTAEHYNVPRAFTYVLIGLHFVLVGTGLIGNGSIFIYFFIKKVKTKADCYTVVLAVSDVLLIILFEPFTVFSNLINFHWIFGHFMCSSVSYMQTACVIQRSCTLVASSIDRYFAIRWPLKEQASRLVVAVIIAAIWIVSLVLSVPVGIYTNMVYRDKSANTSVICVQVWPRDDLRQGFNITLLIITYFIPLLVLLMTYGHICLIVNTKPPGEPTEQLTRRYRAAKRKTIKEFLLASFVHAICWLPIHAITIAGDVNPQSFDNKLMHIFWLFAQCLAISNAAINPVIVLTSKNDFKKKCKTHFCQPSETHRGSETIRKSSFKSRMTKRRSTQEIWV